MSQVIINKERCKGCEFCVNACPQKILKMSKEINRKGYFFSEIIESTKCIGCRLCAISCPEVAIEIKARGVKYLFFDY